jgi:ketosteroid isomerase-like protein
MTQENVDLLRTAYAHASARGIDGFLDFATEDILWISDARFPGGGRHKGRENVRRWLSKLDFYEEISVEVEEIVDLEDRALGIAQWHGVPRDAPPADWLWCHLVSFDGGLISEAQSFLDKPSALEAAGLSK